MEYVLLGDARVSAEGGVVELSAEVFIYRALHPDVDGKRLKVTEAEECCAGGDLIADTADFLKLGYGVVVACGGFNSVKIDLARRDRLCRRKKIAVAKAGVCRKHFFGAGKHVVCPREGEASAAGAADLAVNTLAFP